MVQLDMALFFVRCGMVISPSADAALDSLVYLTTHPVPVELPAAGQELCISPTNDHYWNDVLERYLHQFPLLPRVLTRTKLGDMPLHLCSLYLIFEPEAQARQVFLRIQFLSTNTNWNQAARFAVMINLKPNTRTLYNQFENFAMMGVRNGLVLMSAPRHNRTFTLMADGQSYAMDYVTTVEELPSLLANRTILGLDGRRVEIANQAEFPFLIQGQYQMGGIYVQFFTEFARKYNCLVAFQKRDVQIVPTLYSREFRTKPYAIGSFTGNCLVLPEKPKEGLIYFLLSPFSAPLWYLCVCLLAIAFLLNYRWAQHFPNNILLTVLFGDQATEDEYSPSERRLIFIAVVVMFFFSEAYSAKLLSTFIESLNQPRIRTIESLAASDIPIGVLHFEDIEAYEQLHHNVLIVDEPEYYDNLRHGRHAFMVQCGNAELFLHLEMRRRDTDFRVPYYILEEFIGWRMNGFSVSKFSPVTMQLLQHIGMVGQAGLWEYWREQTVQPLRNVVNRGLTQRETLELKDLISLRYVLIVGYGSAAIMFVIEIMAGSIHRYRQTRREPIDQKR
uniref:Ionotropic glutamate receptor L-glutamate and glycine-binding domain-containing protein n=1 Tax=Anopheles funestus TaxID=62324 RepID=A0A182RIH3_ANOFN